MPDRVHLARKRCLKATKHNKIKNGFIGKVKHMDLEVLNRYDNIFYSYKYTVTCPIHLAYTVPRSIFA